MVLVGRGRWVTSSSSPCHQRIREQWWRTTWHYMTRIWWYIDRERQIERCTTAVAGCAVATAVTTTTTTTRPEDEVSHLTGLEAEHVTILQLGSGWGGCTTTTTAVVVYSWRPQLGRVRGKIHTATAWAWLGAEAWPVRRGRDRLRWGGLFQLSLLQQLAAAGGGVVDRYEAEAVAGSIVKGVIGLFDALLRAGVGQQQRGGHEGGKVCDVGGLQQPGWGCQLVNTDALPVVYSQQT